MGDRPPRPGSMSDADRALASLTQRRTPSSGVPTPWHEEHTGVHTDAQVFRALKSLHGELQANKIEAAKAHGALSQRVASLDTKVAGIETTVGKFDEKLDRVAENSAETTGAVKAMLAQRSRTPSGETKAVAKITTLGKIAVAALGVIGTILAALAAAGKL